MNPLRLAAIASTVALAAAEWAIKDAKLTVSARGTELVSLPFTNEAVDAVVPPEASLDIVFFTTNNGKSAVPHQSMVIIADEESGLEASYPVLVRPNGRAKFAIPHSRLPQALVAAQRPLDVKVILGSFDTKGSETVVARISLRLPRNPRSTRRLCDTQLSPRSSTCSDPLPGRSTHPSPPSSPLVPWPSSVLCWSPGLLSLALLPSLARHPELSRLPLWVISASWVLWSPLSSFLCPTSSRPQFSPRWERSLSSHLWLWFQVCLL